MTPSRPDQRRSVTGFTRQVPKRVALGAAIWAIFGLMEVVLGIAGLLTTSASDTADSASGQLGNGVDTGPGAASGVAFLAPIALGALILAFTVLLLGRRWWARLGLAIAGTAAVVDLAVRGQPMALVAMILLVAAVIPLMSVVSHRFLYGDTGGA